MIMHVLFISIILLFAVSINIGCAGDAADNRAVLNKIRIPKGFAISFFAEGIDNARSITLGDNGIVYVATGRRNAVYALQDRDGDGRAEKRFLIASGLNMPNGIAYVDGSLYVAEIHRIIKFENISRNLAHPPQPVVVYDQFPRKRHHGWKYLRIGPDGKLYTAVGAPCNICDPKQPIFASLVRLNRDGSGFEIIAGGIRNTVGFDWHPATRELFFTENGRDYLGDDAPPEELNKWTEKGQHFGYPYCHADIPDPKFGRGKDCRRYVLPEWRFKAHMAPLGVRFYRGSQFPERYRGQMLVALHGSWNRSQPHGYRVVLIRFRQGKPVSETVFADGWLEKNGHVLGRPVDIIELPDGSLLVSDDHRGAIYRIAYQKTAQE